jgi:hypothetical protein
MKHNGAAHPASAKNGEHRDSSERKSAPGPRHRGVLQENPLAAPTRAFMPKSPQRANPTYLGPWSAHLFQLNSLWSKPPRQEQTIIRDAICRHVLAPEQGDPFHWIS